MTFSTKNSLKQIISNSLLPALQGAGYVLSPYDKRDPMMSYQFHKSAPGRCEVVDVQRDKYWTKLEGKFTINLFLYSEKIEVALGRKAVVEPLVLNSWTLHDRLTFLVSGKDDWWFITEKTNIDTISSQITEMWRTHGAPWFAQHRTVIDFIQAFERRGGSIWPQILLYNYIGDHKKTRLLLFKYLSNASDINEDQVLWLTTNKYIAESRSKDIRLAVIQDRETSRRRVAELLEIKENT